MDEENRVCSTGVCCIHADRHRRGGATLTAAHPRFAREGEHLGRQAASSRLGRISSVNGKTSHIDEDVRFLSRRGDAQDQGAEARSARLHLALVGEFSSGKRSWIRRTAKKASLVVDHSGLSRDALQEIGQSAP
jgi:hypothetical protein